MRLHSFHHGHHQPEAGYTQAPQDHGNLLNMASAADIMSQTIQDVDWGLLENNSIALSDPEISGAASQPPDLTFGRSSMISSPALALEDQNVGPIAPSKSLSGAGPRDLETHSGVLVHDSGSRILTTRRAATPNEFLTTEIVLGQIASYPKNMIEGLVLPSFIHSNCALDDTLSYGCSSKGSHECLSDTLSICSSIVRMFYSKTTASGLFIWKTVHTERAKIQDEV